MARKLFATWLMLVSVAPAWSQAQPGSTFTLRFPAAVHGQPFTGRVFVMLGRAGEPRRGPNWFNPQPFYSQKVVNWRPDSPHVFVADYTFPKPLAELAAGSYVAQAVMDLDLANTHRIGTAPGNLFSKPVRFEFDPNQAQQVALVIDQVVPTQEFRETERVKLVDIESKLLTQFHGKPIRLQAAVGLPESYSQKHDQKYPAIYEIPGFGGTHYEAPMLVGRRTTNRGGVEFLHILLNPDCRTGHHVFADSANNGPYGQALTQELIPAIERRFRLLPFASARLVTGHSSGGWSSLWLQMNYPEVFGGCWSTAPDPVDFRDFQQINLYRPGENMFRDAASKERPIGRRGTQPILYYKPFSDMEEVLGRGGQLQSFEAVFSPKGADGQPRRLWDRQTGQIDPEVAEAWKKYDICLQLRQRWPQLGPRLAGKLHVYMGELDTFYLEGATRLLAEEMKKLGSDASVELFPGKDHGSLMTPELLRRIGEEMAAQFRKHHPASQ